MRYRLLDMLICNHCGGDLSINIDKKLIEELPDEELPLITCSYFCAFFNIKNPNVSNQECSLCLKIQIIDGSIYCKDCGNIYKIKEGVPDFTSKDLLSDCKAKEKQFEATNKRYSFLWNTVNNKNLKTLRYHYDCMQEAIPEKIVKGKIGLEIGCGYGMDTRIMARKALSTEIIAVDISEGVYKAQYFNRNCNNVYIVRASALNLPIRTDLLDFCYSFGVIHHTPDPRQCFSEILRVLRPGRKAYLYLYEDHENNKWKRYPLKIISLIRVLTSKLDANLLYFSCLLLSPVVFGLFTVPTLILRHFNKTKKLADYMPFNFGKNPFSLAGDLYDRLGAPIELRFNKARLSERLKLTGFRNIQFARLQTSAGLVVWVEK